MAPRKRKQAQPTVVTEPVPTAEQAPAPMLARHGDPLVLPDGQIIDPETDLDEPNPSETEAEIEARSALSAGNNAARALLQQVNPADFRPTTRRSMRELPAPTGVMNAVSVVFVGTLLGLGDRELAENLRITIEQLQEIRQHTAYNEVFETILTELLNTNSDLIQSRLAAYSHNALTQIHQISSIGKQETNRLRASQDILDRAGHRPKDSNARNNPGSNTLRIVYTDDQKQTRVEVNVNQGEL